MYKKIVALFALCSLLFTGCSYIEQDTEPYETPPKSKIEREAERTVERVAETEHVAPELSDDFMQRYLDMDNFETLKKRTEAGIAAAQRTADLTEKEARLWADILATQELNQYTVNDLEQKKAELYRVLENMARTAEEQMLDKYLAEQYELSEAETEAFVEKQAKKYVNEDTGENTDGISKNADESIE